MIDFQDPTTWDAPMTDADALSMAIFALNTLAEPSASSDEQMAALDFFTEGALERLVEIRDRAANVSDAAPDVEVIVTRSAGDDRAVLVFIDTTFEPFAAGPDDLGLRVLINDDEAYVGKGYDLGANHHAKARKFEVRLDDIAYTDAEED
jgi:hypothetical protein